MIAMPAFLGFWSFGPNVTSKARRKGRRPNNRPLAASIEQLETRTMLSAVAGHSPGVPDGEHSVARLWNEELLDAIRLDTPRPTVHARNLFHTSVAMYDAWAAYESTARGYLHEEFVVPANNEAAQAAAISFAAYRVLTDRFESSPGAAVSLASFDDLMERLGYDPSFTSTEGNSPAAVGNRVARTVIEFGLGDGSNQAGNFADTTGYAPVNPPLDVTASGATLNDANRWQPLIVGGSEQVFLTPHWGDVASFAMTRSGPDSVYHDPGRPPQLGGAEDAEFKEAIVRVIGLSAVLDPALGTTIDVSPAVFFNNPLGTNDGTGYDVNPVTGEPYEPNVVNLGDWGRVLAEFWADGPDSETPPGHWNTIANHVSDRMDELETQKRIGGSGRSVDELEWDVKLYFTLNGAVHDAAIAAWDAKERYDYVRPISMIRHMGGLGQSTDPTLTLDGVSTFHPDGLPLIPDLIEVITDASIADGRHAHLAGHEGEIAIFAWAGHPDDPDDVGGVDWILAEDWLPYQAENFVTPPFAAFISGHSTFSRASAEVLTHFTGSAYFPGGLGTFRAPAGEFLRFENGPSEDLELQWATYYDAADEAGLSRLYGGIHVDADDFDGRVIGSHVGVGAYQLATTYFTTGRGPGRGRGGESGAARPAGAPAGRGAGRFAAAENFDLPDALPSDRGAQSPQAREPVQNRVALLPGGRGPSNSTSPGDGGGETSTGRSELRAAPERIRIGDAERSGPVELGGLDSAFAAFGRDWSLD